MPNLSIEVEPSKEGEAEVEEAFGAVPDVEVPRFRFGPARRPAPLSIDVQDGPSPEPSPGSEHKSFVDLSDASTAPGSPSLPSVSPNCSPLLPTVSPCSSRSPSPPRSRGRSFPSLVIETDTTEKEALHRRQLLHRDLLAGRAPREPLRLVKFAAQWKSVAAELDFPEPLEKEAILEQLSTVKRSPVILDEFTGMMFGRHGAYRR